MYEHCILKKVNKLLGDHPFLHTLPMHIYEYIRIYASQLVSHEICILNQRDIFTCIYIHVYLLLYHRHIKHYILATASHMNIDM